MDIGCGLVNSFNLAAKPSAGPDSQPRVGTYSINRPECTKVLLALFSQRLICSSLYDTLGVLAHPTPPSLPPRTLHVSCGRVKSKPPSCERLRKNWAADASGRRGSLTAC
jgi:hypothetical protein